MKSKSERGSSRGIECFVTRQQSSSSIDLSSSPPPLHLPVCPHPHFSHALSLHAPVLLSSPSAHIAGRALVFTPRCLFFLLYLHLFALIVSPFPSGPVSHSVTDSLNGTLPLLLSSPHPSDPSLPSRLPPAHTHFIYPSLQPSFIIHESDSEREKRDKDASATSRGSSAGVSVWILLGFASAQRSSLIQKKKKKADDMY